MTGPVRQTAQWLQHQWLWLIGYRGLAFTARPAFRVEMRAQLAWAIVAGFLEGQFAGFLALRALAASETVIAFINAAPAFANLLAVVWAAYAAGKDRRAMTAIPLFMAAALLLSVPFTLLLPDGRSDSLLRADLLFAVQVCTATVLLTFANTVRNGIWRTNYPTGQRGQILARFQVWSLAASVIYVFALGKALDLSIQAGLFHGHGERIYAILVPLTGSAAALAAVIYLYLPIRGEPIDAGREKLRSWLSFPGLRVNGGPEAARHPGRPNRSAKHALARGDLPLDNAPATSHFPTLRDPATLPDDPATSHTAVQHGSEGTSARRAWSAFRRRMTDCFAILQTDRDYRDYQVWQMIQGTGMMLLLVPLVIIVERTFEASYAFAAVALVVVPRLVMAVTLPAWARHFDRVDVWDFRAMQTWFLFASRAVLLVAVLQVWWPLLLLAMALQGIALAAGQISWQLGHMQFATEANNNDYMAVHTTLTGVRGCVAPFLGQGIYLWIGNWVVAVSAAVLLLSTVGFNVNARRRRSESPSPDLQ